MLQYAIPTWTRMWPMLIPGSWTLLQYLAIIFVVGLIILYLRKKYSNNCDATRTRWFTDPSEHDRRVIYGKMSSSMEPHHILWTGGYDSTFVLCYYFIIRQEPVQPIYLMCGNMDSKLGIVGRNNQAKELETMKLIRRRLLARYPEQTGLLYPTIYVTSVKKNNIVTRAFQKLHRRNKYFSRDVTQYERIARFSLDWQRPVLVGLEQCGTGLDEATQGHRMGEGQWELCQIKSESMLPSNHKELYQVFRNIRFPICHLTKEEMKLISLRSGSYFYDMLLDSWSCWFPRPDGSACNECQMCTNRIS